jgi:hypothetical protein
MAFAPKALVRMAHPAPVGLATGLPKAAQISMFLYGTDDAAATVETAAYFNSARAQLNVGDIILATMAHAGTPVTKQYVVTAAPKTTGNVTIAIQTVTAG